MASAGMLHVDFSEVEDPEWAVSAEHLEIIIDRGCIRCGAQTAPEPSDAERKLLFDDPDRTWEPPPGDYLYPGFGLMGGGYGPYVCCDRCGFFVKHDLGTEAE